MSVRSAFHIQLKILMGQRFAFFVFWTPNILKSGLATHLLMFISQYQTGYTKPQWESITIFPMLPVVELPVLMLKETEVCNWYLSDKTRIRHNPRPLQGAPSVLEEQRQTYKKLFGSDINYQAS
jgi:hypothetical protein